MMRSLFSASRPKINLVANLAANGWSALAQLALIPLYIRIMGIEAYGLVGFYLTLQGALQILDFGLSPTMNRQMARYSVQPKKAGEARDFVRTLEAGYWAVGIAIGAAIMVAAPFVATQWIKASAISTNVVQQAVMSMGALAALQWPLSLYQGGLLGLQRQALLSGLQIGMTTLRGGAVLILWLVSPTITAFFAWQIIVSAIQISLTTIFLWRSLPTSGRAPRFDPGLIRNIWRFAAGLSGITFFSLILTQLDKVILSNLISLEKFGYYTLAGIIGGSLMMVIVPVFNTIFPRFSALAAMGNEEILKRLYHFSSQVMAVIILPAAAVVALFSFDVVLLWTGNAETARNAAPIASVLVIGTALNGLMNPPYALQLAHGWTRIWLRIHMFSVLIFVPAIFFLATRYGAMGAAAVWVALNGIFIVIGVPLIHRRLLKGEAPRWFAEDVGLPLAGAIGVAWIGRQLIVSPMPPRVAVAALSAVWLAALAMSALAAPHIRRWALGHLSRIWMMYAASHRHSTK